MRSKLTLFVLLAMFACRVVNAQDPAAINISLRTQAITLKQLAAQIATESKLKFEVSPNIASDIMLVKVDQVPLRQLMDRIAQVTSGEWKLTGDIWKISRPDTITNAQARADATTIGKDMQKSILKVLAAMNKAPKYDVQFLAKYFNQGNNPPTPDKPELGWNSLTIDPGQRAIVRILSSMSPETLGSIGPMRRVVFSATPTRMQRPLPGSAGSIIEAYRRERLVWDKQQEIMRKSQPKVDPSMPIDEAVPADGNFQEATMEPPMERGPLGPIKKVLLSITRNQGPQATLSILLRVYGMDGKEMAVESYYASREDPDAAQAVSADRPPERPSVPDMSELKLSKISDQLVKLISTFVSMDGANFNMPQELREALEDPVAFDPLNLILSDAILAISDSNKTNLVAMLPDDAMEVMQVVFSGGAKMNISTVKGMIENSGSLLAEEKDGWYTLKPKLPSMSRYSHLNRDGLRLLIAEHKKQGYVSLDSFAKFAITCNNPQNNTLYQIYMFLVCPSAMRYSMGESPWEILQIYGLMNPQQRQNLNLQGRLYYREFSSIQRNLLEQFVFFSDRSLELNASEESPVIEFSGMPMMGMRSAGIYQSDSGLENEPTEALPLGLPFEGYLDIKSNTKTVFSIEADNPMMTAFFGATGMEIDQLAMMLAMQKRPEQDEYMRMMPKIEAVKIGNLSTHQFSFWLAPKTRMSAVLTDMKTAKDAKAVKIADLPADILKQLKEKMDAFEKSMSEGGGMPAGGPPKPPLN